MLFAVLFEDNPTQAAELRRKHLPDHLRFLEKHKEWVVAAGPLVSAAGEAQGGLWLVEAEDRETVDRMVREDPFWPTGLRKSVRISAWKQVFAEGRRQI
ncbi:YciI family protein [Pelagibius sp.]|uniref:YciI family protein n=1 Tax=Pelagibius sp. TaxID=1931238 RepID=UPI0026025829|nr:YciI family protein [Pelagibius sp.]